MGRFLMPKLLPKLKTNTLFYIFWNFSQKDFGDLKICRIIEWSFKQRKTHCL